jgi:hypothetical protein
MRGFLLPVLILSVVSCSAPPPPPPAAIKDDSVTLTCRSRAFRSRHPLFLLLGGCPLSDGAIVSYRVHVSVDVLRGDRLVSESESAGMGMCEVENRHFSLEHPVDRSGRYTFVVSIPWDMQGPNLLKEVQEKFASKRTWSWTFEFPGEARFFESGRRLADLALLVESAFDLVAGFDLATRSEELWNQEKDSLVARCNALRSRPANPDLQLYFPAAVRSLDGMFRYLAVNSRDFVFRDGKFSGLRGRQVQPLGAGPFLIDPNDNSPWDGFKRCAKEARAIAGREFCLGVIRSLRGSNGVLKPEVAAALEAAKEAPGVRPWAATLQAATLADLGKIEDEVRNPGTDPVK